MKGQNGKVLAAKIFSQLLGVHVLCSLGDVVGSARAGAGTACNGAEDRADVENFTLSLLFQSWQESLSHQSGTNNVGLEHLQQLLPSTARVVEICYISLLHGR